MYGFGKLANNGTAFRSFAHFMFYVIVLKENGYPFNILRIPFDFYFKHRFIDLGCFVLKAI